MSNNQKISFWNLLKKQNIIIPIIQRDYAQGREGKEYLRQKFLGDLKEALDGGSLTLDFVYGSQKGNGCIEPLDGQQRLTTLWLLHWYIAYKTGALDNEDIQAILKKFSYETRVSSREFCEKLCELKLNENSSLLDYIQQQTWFFSVWKQDPTIQAMLRMLCGVPNSDEKNKTEIIDGIDELFGKCTKDHLKMYWERLTKDNSIECPITFYEMTIGTNELPLSDDLYIKMNARGKPLTSFENFKADLIKWIGDNMSQEESIGYASLIDNQWTDVFWENSNGNKIGHVDEAFFAFINRYFYNLVLTTRFLSDSKLKDDKGYDYFANKVNENYNLDNQIVYNSFEYYEKYLNEDKTILARFGKIFEKLSNSDKYNYICKWDEKFCFIPQYKLDENNKPIEIKDNVGNTIFDINAINQRQRVAFYAICKYLETDETEDDELDSFTHWMRFVWNLVSVKDKSGLDYIRNIDNIKRAMNYIDMINSHRVYMELSSEKDWDIKDTDLDLQFKEEVVKAKQIVAKQNDGPTEQEIIEAENYAFFNGAIRFLYTDENGGVDWTTYGKKIENIKNVYFPSNRKGGNIIKQMIPYLEEADIRNIFSEFTLSDKDSNLHQILLRHSSKVHNFLTNGKIVEMSKLHQDIEDLCVDCSDYLIHLEWVEDMDVLSKYSFRSGYYKNESYFVGTSFIEERLKILELINGVVIEGDNKLPKKGLYIEFTYKDNYAFCWNEDDWVYMFEDGIKLCDKGNNGENKIGELYTHLHTYYKVAEKYAEDTDEHGNTVSCVFTDADSLKKELDRCIKIYEDIQ